MNTALSAIVTTVLITLSVWIYYKRYRNGTGDRAQGQSKSESKNQTQKVTSEADEIKVIVKNINQLSHCLQSHTPFRFDPNFTQLILSHIYEPVYRHILEALKDNQTITRIVLTDLPRSDLKGFVRCLTEHNRSIRTITLTSYNFESNLTQSIAQILKVNERIKVLEIMYETRMVSMEGLGIFCSNMEHYKFEELLISHANLSAACFDALLEGLKTNRSIKSIKIEGEPNLEGNRLAVLYGILISNQIREFWNYGNLDHHYEEFQKVLKANYLTKLKLQGRLDSSLNLGNIAEDLKSNTSITDLTVCTNPLDWNPLKDIIIGKKNIKKLHLSHMDFFLPKLTSLKLGSNSSITDLTITSWRVIPVRLSHYGELFSELCKNNTLQRLEFSTRTDLEGTADLTLQMYLTKNYSLKELKIVLLRSGELSERIIRAIAKGLAANKSIRKLYFKLSRIDYQVMSEFIEALKTNTSLLELHIGKIRDIGLHNAGTNGKDIDDFILDLLKSNKTLQFIEGASEYPHLEDKLKSNRDTQDQIIGDTCLLIKMIVAKPVSFILPIEIWLHVFEYLSYSFTDVDFAMFLRSLLK